MGAFNGSGVVALIGVTHEDTTVEAEWVARKIADLRILHDERSVSDVDAPVMVISQFTLYAKAVKGRRPSWNNAAPGPVAEPLVDEVVVALRARGVEVVTGIFGANMQVTFTNDGPVTIILDTADR